MVRSRRFHSSAFKAEVAIEAISSGQSLSELGKRLDIHPKLIAKWKALLIKQAETAFMGEEGAEGVSTAASGSRSKVITKTKREIRFMTEGLARALDANGRGELVRPDHEVPVKRQAELLSLARSTIYYRRKTGKRASPGKK